MAGPLLLREVLLLRLKLHNYQRFAAGIAVPPHRLFCSASTNSESSGQADEKTSYAAQMLKLLRAQVPPSQSSTDDPSNHSSTDNPDYRKWKNKEDEILKDIEPIVRLTKEILHSKRSLSDTYSLSGSCCFYFFRVILSLRTRSHHPIVKQNNFLSILE